MHPYKIIKPVKAAFITIFIVCYNIASLAQAVKISGRVIDAENNSPVVGASVVIDETNKGTSTDVDGRYFLAVEKAKKIMLTISSVGYAAKTLNDVVPGSEGQTFEVVLQRASTQLEQVTVRSNAKKESVASLYLLQKNSSSISDGISSEVIRKSPDKNTGEVLKRVSGASVQDNKFVIVRGLSERYNTSMLNNSVLPSTEPDKKAFAFDIIPSSVIDNLIIYKTATPDLPGDFAGGAIKVTTKDYPSVKINELSASVSYNSLTTFKNFYKSLPEGKLDWLGYYDDSRLIPNAYYRNKYNFINLSDNQKSAITKLFPNTYGYSSAYRSLPNVSVGYTGGDTKLLGGNKKLGYIYAVGYSEGRRVSSRLRDEYETFDYFNYRFNTDNYDMRANTSALLNLTYSYGRNKIAWKNLYNNDFIKTVGLRNGYDVSNGADEKFLVKSSNSETTTNGIVNSVLEGSHSLNKTLSIDWNASYGLTYRWQPDQKIVAFHTGINSPDYTLTLSNENSPEIRNAGRVYSFLQENIYGANVNATKQFQLLGQVQKLKIGTSNYYRDRNAEADALGYSLLNAYGNRVSISETKTTTYNNIFNPGNIDVYHLTVANIPTNSTDYNGTALMNAGYAMLDNKFSDKVKLTWGARVENYTQELKSKNRTNTKLNNFDVLPSALLTYSLSNKTNVRLSGSQSVNRPEFRELADYSVYDYDNNFVIRGNPNLVRSKNTNADLRYEWFPSAGEIVSASFFYKYFDDPIEQVNNGNDVLSYSNANNANAYGAEIELRKKLDFIGTSNFFKNLTFYANAAYIKGSVEFAGQTINSPLQGQSPYLLNGGLTYAVNNDDFSMNILYNRIGPRLRFRAVTGAAKNIFEKPRDVMDVQVSKKFFKHKLEARLSINDILAQAYTWYYKYEQDPSNTNYKASTDRVLNSIKYGTTSTLSLKYTLGK